MNKLLLLVEKRDAMMRLIDEGKIKEAKKVFDEISKLYEEITGNNFKEKFLDNNEENRRLLKIFFENDNEQINYGPDDENRLIIEKDNSDEIIK